VARHARNNSSTKHLHQVICAEHSSIKRVRPRSVPMSHDMTDGTLTVFSYWSPTPSMRRWNITFTITVPGWAIIPLAAATSYRTLVRVNQSPSVCVPEREAVCAAQGAPMVSAWVGACFHSLGSMFGYLCVRVNCSNCSS